MYVAPGYVLAFYCITCQHLLHSVCNIFMMILHICMYQVWIFFWRVETHEICKFEQVFLRMLFLAIFNYLFLVKLPVLHVHLLWYGSYMSLCMIHNHDKWAQGIKLNYIWCNKHFLKLIHMT